MLLIGVSQIFFGSIILAVSLSRNIVFICTSLGIYDFRGCYEVSEKVMRISVAKRIGCSTRFDKLDTGLGSCSPILFDILLYLKLSFYSQKDSKSKKARTFNNLSSFVFLIPKEASLSEKCPVSDIRSSDKGVSLVHCMQFNFSPICLFGSRRYH